MMSLSLRRHQITVVDKILVLDFGSQYNQLIARRIRQFGVYSELVSHDIDIKLIKNDPAIKAIIFSGGPNSVIDKDAFTISSEIYDCGIPILGICYGMQLMVHQFHGVVTSSQIKEYGKANMILKQPDLITKGLKTKQVVWMSHGDQVSSLPSEFTALAYTENNVLAMIKHQSLPFYGVQFHPEVTHSEQGLALLRNFVFEIAHAQANWKIESFIQQQVNLIKKQVGNDRVLLGLSGGVDSSVVAALLHQAIKDQLTCVFVDHGCLRENEAHWVGTFFKENMKLNLISVDASALFLERLQGVSDPETKRKIIGHTFIEVFEQESKKIPNIKWLAQGTLYTDIIESGTKTAETIKSHHNVGGLPETMQLKLIEPLKTLFKDEVREVGKQLELPDQLINRQPFPGPGLAIRIIGDVTAEKIRIVQQSDTIFHQCLNKYDVNKDIWQAFTVCTNTKSVGVMGDQRTVGYTVACRAITSIDGMSADVAMIPYECLLEASNRIVNEVAGVNRVVYDITSKPPATIEWE